MLSCAFLCFLVLTLRVPARACKDDFSGEWRDASTFRVTILDPGVKVPVSSQMRATITGDIRDYEYYDRLTIPTS